MNNETFRILRQMLMEHLDLSRELTDKEILEQIDELLLIRGRRFILHLKDKVILSRSCFIPSVNWMCFRNWWRMSL